MSRIRAGSAVSPATRSKVSRAAAVFPASASAPVGGGRRVRSWNRGGGKPPNLRHSTGMCFGRLAGMRDAILELDATRPVGIGCHTPGTVGSPVYDPLDMTGWNYGRRYEHFRETYPNHPILYSESASTFSTRGYYNFPQPGGKTDYVGGTDYLSSYDFNAASWSDIPDFEFKLMEDDRFVGGEFVWTGFDYLGEPTPNRGGARSSYFGIVDLAGIPKDRYYLYRSHWRPDATTIHILPHWNWPDRVGQNVPVFVYTNGDSAELFLNGKSLGRRSKGEVPPKPADLASGKPTTTSGGEAAGAAVDGDDETAWIAPDPGGSPWMQVDLGSVQPVKFIDLTLGASTGNVRYAIKVSEDGEEWTTVAEVEPLPVRRGFGGGNRGGPSQTTRDLAGHNAQGRHVRLEWGDLPEESTASVAALKIYPERYESEYYDVTYDYRLRWNEVSYEPGELKVVAYKDGAKLGEQVMRTAGPPASLRLTPDRSELEASGEDLSFILVEALDKRGNLAPLADNMIEFEVNGAGELAAVDNGDQLSLDSFQDDCHALFHGKAMLIVRTRDGEAGPIEVTARSSDLQEAAVTLESSR